MRYVPISDEWLTVCCVAGDRLPVREHHGVPDGAGPRLQWLAAHQRLAAGPLPPLRRGERQAPSALQRRVQQGLPPCQEWAWVLVPTSCFNISRYLWYYLSYSFFVSFLFIYMYILFFYLLGKLRYHLQNACKIRILKKVCLTNMRLFQFLKFFM